MWVWFSLLLIDTLEWDCWVKQWFFIYLLRNCHAILQSSRTILRSHRQCLKVPVSPHPCQLLSLSDFFFLLWLSWYPTAAITNYQQPSDLKQHTFIILQFWRSEVWNGSHGSKIKVLAGLYFSLETLGENLPPNPFQLLETDLYFWVHGPVSLQSQQWRHFDLCCCYHILFSDSSPLASLLHLKEFLWWHWAHVDNPSSSPITRSLS